MAIQDRGVLVADRYRLEHPIAAGATGEVWRAADLVLDRPVAVKVLRPEYAGQPQALARFRAEARQAGSLSHPAVAHVYDFGESGPAGTPFLVMELVDGPSLADVLAAGPLDPAAAMDVLAQTAAGLQAAHSAGLVHRDIKPANLLIGPGGQVKITDFGIAHAAGSVPLTLTGQVIGTPAYLAPERAAGAGASPASDLYSLGVVGYECLAGTPPFRGIPLEVAAAHQHQPLPPLPAGVPAGAAELVSRLTAKDPAHRPASAGACAQIAARLRDSLAGGAVSSLAAAAAAAAGGAGGGRTGSSGTLVYDRPPELAAPTRVAPARRPRRRRVVLALAGVAAVAALGGVLAAQSLSETPAPAVPPASQASPAAPAAPSSPAARTVSVDSSRLVGEQVGDVTRQLRELGLVPVVRLTGSGHDDGGGGGGTDPDDLSRATVVSVTPDGPVPAGTTVTVTATLAGRHHHHGHGDDDS